MIKHALFVGLEARPGKEKEVAQFLRPVSASRSRKPEPRYGSPCKSAHPPSAIPMVMRGWSRKSQHAVPAADPTAARSASYMVAERPVALATATANAGHVPTRNYEVVHAYGKLRITVLEERLNVARRSEAHPNPTAQRAGCSRCPPADYGQQMTTRPRA
jgi:hypothetical protein